MARTREIALVCRIHAGGFSGERIAQVTLASGGVQMVLAPRHYCWNHDGRPLAPNQPELGHALDGIVAARLIEEAQGVVKVTTPDGEVFVVSADTVKPRPEASEIPLHVPV